MVNISRRETVLVVDDSPATLKIIQRNLAPNGFTVFASQNVTDAIGILEENEVDIVITDYKMPRINGLDLVRHVRQNFSDIEIMMITGYATIDGAVEAVKAGADEYLAKPFTDEELLAAVKKVSRKLKDKRTANIKVKSKEVQFKHYDIIGESKPMQVVYKAIKKASAISATALITGESGTGKELVARAIHYGSKRSAAPFVPINCGGIPENLLESELFGHVKGAFTGATRSRAGFFLTAEGGTIFLDEISETSLAMQVKLLRVLQDKEVSMIGSDKISRADVRIIAATNKDLQELVRKNFFREDLYFRLNVITIDIPPLRERGDDILILVNHFLNKFSAEYDIDPPEFSEEVLSAFVHYSWPGNVRELENFMQRLLVMTDSKVITMSDLPSLMKFTVQRKQGYDKTLAEIEAEYIQKVLASVNGNKSKAAHILGIDRKTLYAKIENSHNSSPD